jgi:hypothetical protein
MMTATGPDYHVIVRATRHRWLHNRARWPVDDQHSVPISERPVACRLLVVAERVGCVRSMRLQIAQTCTLTSTASAIG